MESVMESIEQSGASRVSDPLAELLHAAALAQKHPEVVEQRRSLRFSAIQREIESIEKDISGPKVLRDRNRIREAKARANPGLKENYGDILQVQGELHAKMQESEALQAIDASRGWQNAVGYQVFPVPTSSTQGLPVLQPGSGTSIINLTITAPTPLAHTLVHTGMLLGASPAAYSQNAMHCATSGSNSAPSQGSTSISPLPTPSLKHLVLFNELPATTQLGLPTQSPITFPFALAQSAAGRAAASSAFASVPIALASSPFSLLASPFSAPTDSTYLPTSSHQADFSEAFSSAGNGHRKSGYKSSTGLSSPTSHSSSNSSSPVRASHDHSHYTSAPATPTSSDEDSSSTTGRDSSSLDSAISLENCNSPALLPGCGIYSEYIHDLRSVCPQCSASGRLKSKKKPLVDSLLLLAFFGDGIKKTPNGLGYIIEDSNLARELMNNVSSHIRPPSRGTNNSYDNWKRAMGKTFRKSGSFFTPKDEDTARYARHVEEHISRIYERKKATMEGATH